MNSHWIKFVSVVLLFAVVFYALVLVTGDNGSVVEIVKNLIHAVFAGAVVAG